MHVGYVSGSSFLSGKPIPSSGLYEVIHEQHCLPKQVTLLRDRVFPYCSACSVPIHFSQVRTMDYLDKLDGKIVLHVLPVLDKNAA